jgi:hypothetical protein
MPSAKSKSSVDVTMISPAMLRALIILVEWEDEWRPKRAHHFKGLWASHFARLMWPDSPAWAKRTGNRSGLWQRAGALLWKMYKIGLVLNHYDKDSPQNFWRPAEAARRGVEGMSCYHCEITEECPVAWDSYNTGGECLNK